MIAELKRRVADAGGIPWLWDALGLSRRGTAARCPDPSHDDAHPSAQLHDDGWICHGCGARGDALGLMAHTHGAATVREQIAALCEVLGCDRDELASAWRPSISQQRQRARASHEQIPPDPVLTLEQATHAAEVWSHLGPEPLPERHADWLRSRGIDPDAAWAHGVRPTMPARWIGPARSTDDRVEGDWPSALRAEGVAIPVVADDCGEAPVAYRVRPLPGTWWHREVAKSLSVGGEWGTWPLGLERAHVARPTVIVEGEMDWLAARCVAADSVRVVGLLAVGGAWPRTVRDVVRDAPTVWVCTHDTDQGRAVYVRAVQARRGRGATHRWHRPEDDDLCDLHERGRLAPLLDALGVSVTTGEGV